MNFKNFGNDPSAMEGDSGSGHPPGNFSLARQGSIYSLTFDELQNTMGSIGKDFGSMNMDELLKNIWSAEESQTMGTTGSIQDGGVPGGNLQRQGSLTLPRTLSQKTVDEVWKDISKEYGSGFEQANFPQRQQTLGEMTLEEFLVKAGVVREEAQLVGKPNDTTGLIGNLANPQNHPGFGIGFQQPNQNTAVMANVIAENNNNQIAFQSTALPLSVNGVRSTQQQQQIFPKQPTLSYGPPMSMQNSSQLASPGTRDAIVGISDPTLNGNLIQASFQGGGIGMAGLGAGSVGQVTVANGSPAISSDGMGKSNGDTSSVSPTPYVFNGVLRKRKVTAVEKVVERRQRRMIKNRESAARSRARKQAYTMELEAEVSKLKEQNQELRKKQAEIMEMQKNQALENMNAHGGVKRRCLRRTQSGPW